MGGPGTVKEPDLFLAAHTQQLSKPPDGEKHPRKAQDNAKILANEEARTVLKIYPWTSIEFAIWKHDLSRLRNVTLNNSYDMSRYNNVKLWTSV